MPSQAQHAAIGRHLRRVDLRLPGADQREDHLERARHEVCELSVVELDLRRALAALFDLHPRELCPARSRRAGAALGAGPISFAMPRSGPDVAPALQVFDHLCAEHAQRLRLLALGEQLARRDGHPLHEPLARVGVLHRRFSSSPSAASIAQSSRSIDGPSDGHRTHRQAL